MISQALEKLFKMARRSAVTVIDRRRKEEAKQQEDERKRASERLRELALRAGMIKSLCSRAGTVFSEVFEVAPEIRSALNRYHVSDQALDSSGAGSVSAVVLVRKENEGVLLTCGSPGFLYLPFDKVGINWQIGIYTFDHKPVFGCIWCPAHHPSDGMVKVVESLCNPPEMVKALAMHVELVCSAKSR
jgi:hypothetical protein